jgi:DNA primase
LIPDAIKRSVYIQETSSLLKIPETVLLTELNKILIDDRKKKAEKAPTDVKEQTIPTFEDTPSKLDAASMVTVQERESIRLLLNYAESHYEEQRLLDFMLTELDDVEFTNPVLKQIYDEFKQGAERGEVIDTLYLMEHGTVEMKQTVAELTTTKYETSRHWGEKFHIYIPHEKEIVNNVAYTNVLRLKFRLIQKLMEENLEQLKQATSESDMEKYFTIHENLKGAERQLASILGIVITR